MAATVTETAVIQTSADGEGRLRVCGTITSTGTTTSYVIAPGNNSVNITSPVTSKALRHIDTWCLSNATAQKAPVVVKSYNSTYDCEVLTTTNAADDSYDWWVEGPANT